MVAPLAALKAYTAAQKVMDTGAAPTGDVASGPDFSKVLSNVIGGLEQTSKAAEGQMAAHAAGKADLVDVVTSVASAETSLETVMSIRDQVISAYQEILRMPI
ncbi:MAG TPA: flagellar hook-basal body complex protein FliE [Caulobacteraceae bacterium]|jgi:flagellar hook-basal body complex protein FliE|nr:flagellar hook-basal body complex protein FliE [Caulobacteraceae bacterium]